MTSFDTTFVESNPARNPFPANWLIAQEFDPNENLMNLKGKDYLNVQNRMVWFIRDQRALIAAGLARQAYSVKTELVELDREKGWAHFKTTVIDVLGNSSTAYGSEAVKDFADYIEKAATKSLGRALIGLGYGTQFAPEISEDEDKRVVDAPVERRTQPSARLSAQSSAPQAAPQRTQQSAPQATERPATPPAPKVAAPAPAVPARAPSATTAPSAATVKPRTGMTAEEEAKYEDYIRKFGKEFMQVAIAKCGFNLKQIEEAKRAGIANPSIRQAITEEQIAALFDNINDWYSEWVAKQANPVAASEPNAEPEQSEEPEETEAPIDEEKRYLELRRQVLDYCIDVHGSPVPALFGAALTFILPRVPVPAGTAPLSPADLRGANGKPISDVALLAQRGIALKTYNDLVASLLDPTGDEEETLITFLAQRSDQLGVKTAA